MFAVPGWSLSAPLKTQKDISEVPALSNENGTTEAPPSSKKRKRSHTKSKGPVVNSENVVELWETHIEGRKPQKVANGKEKASSHEKKRKLNTTSEANGDQERNSGGETVNIGEAIFGGEERVQNPETKRRNEKKKKKKEKLKRQLEAAEKGQQPQAKGKKGEKENKDTKTSATDETPKDSIKAVPNKLVMPQSAAKLTPLQISMRAKLASARFRHLNQTLYTSPSTKAFDLFTENPEMYSEYHAGFRQQVEVWPENPVDGYINLIKLRGKAKLNKKGEVKGHKPAEAKTENEIKLLPRTQGACTIADLGCGDARLSQSLQPVLKKLQMKIFSFDLHSDSPLVQRADISALPLADGSVNVAIFCLALMGTNWTDFIDEAYRILHWKGELWVAEIKSRFARAAKGKVVDHSIGKRKKKPSQMSDAQRKKAEEAQKQEDDTLAVEVDGVENLKGETDVTPFVQVLRRRGFVLDASEEDSAVDLGNRMFVRMRFVKAVAPTKGKNVQAATTGMGLKPGMPSKTNFRGKYVRTDPDADDGMDENTVLKPCVYKLR